MACHPFGKVREPLVHVRGMVTTRVPAARRLIFLTLVIVAVVFGYLGFASYLRGDTRFGHDPLDLLYDDLQLFVLGPFPLQQGDGAYPVALQIGRLTAPLVTVFAFVEAGRLVLAAELARLRTRRAHGHVVVCGAGATARALAERLRSAGQRVVTIRPDGDADPWVGRYRVFGDATTPDVLRAAGVRRARTLYACTDDSATNTIIALTASRIAQDGRPGPALYAQVTDPDLCLALQARHLGLAHQHRLRLGFFNVDELAARKLFAERQLRYTHGRAPRVLVVGASAFGRAVVVELGRRWRTMERDPHHIPTVILVDDEASSAVAELGHRYRFLGQACRLCPYDCDLTELLAGMTDDDRPTCTFICYDDEEKCLRTALTMDRLWHGGYRSMVVRLDRLAGLQQAFGGSSQDALLDEVSGSLQLFGVVEAACDPDLIREDLIERLARVIHDRYRIARLRRGDVAAGNPSMVDWEQLPVALRRSNRAQAADVGHKLSTIGCVLAPRIAPGEEFALTDDTIELLAEMEHRRWLAERTGAGWCYAEIREDFRRRHPDVRPWEALSEAARDKNRDAIRELAAIVGDAGLRIVQI